MRHHTTLYKTVQQYINNHIQHVLYNVIQNYTTLYKAI